MKEREILQGMLAEFFKYNKYPDAIKKLKHEISSNALYKEHWSSVKKMIEHKQLKPGESLNMVHISANLPLDENTDEEAYRWLNLMVRNIESNEEVEAY